VCATCSFDRPINVHPTEIFCKKQSAIESDMTYGPI
jgi:hypothetical protein